MTQTDKTTELMVTADVPFITGPLVPVSATEMWVPFMTGLTRSAPLQHCNELRMARQP